MLDFIDLTAVDLFFGGEIVATSILTAPQNAEFFQTQTLDYRDLIQFAATNWNEFEAGIEAKFGFDTLLNDRLVDAGVTSVQALGYEFQVQPGEANVFVIDPLPVVEPIYVPANDWY